MADSLFGVTMEEPGVSMLISVKLGGSAAGLGPARKTEALVVGGTAAFP